MPHSALCFRLGVPSQVHPADAAPSDDQAADGPEWLIELKLDGFRALAIKRGGKLALRSRNDKDFNARYPGLVKAL